MFLDRKNGLYTVVGANLGKIFLLSLHLSLLKSFVSHNDLVEPVDTQRLLCATMSPSVAKSNLSRPVSLEDRADDLIRKTSLYRPEQDVSNARTQINTMFYRWSAPRFCSGTIFLSLDSGRSSAILCFQAPIKTRRASSGMFL